MKPKKNTILYPLLLLVPVLLGMTSCEHTHRYEVSYEHAPTCLETGEREHECRTCGGFYREKIDPVGHRYEVEREEAPTCSSAGYNDYRCAACDDRTTETEDALGHIYAEGDCSLSLPCARCGESVVRGHSGEENFCDRCDACIFEPLTFTGSGAVRLDPITLPRGYYDITVTYSGDYTLALYLGDRLLANDYGKETFTVCLSPSDTLSFPETGGTPIENGSFRVETAGGTWTISVVAVKE